MFSKGQQLSLKGEGEPWGVTAKYLCAGSSYCALPLYGHQVSRCSFCPWNVKAKLILMHLSLLAMNYIK